MAFMIFPLELLQKHSGNGSLRAKAALNQHGPDLEIHGRVAGNLEPVLDPAVFDRTNGHNRHDRLRGGLGSVRPERLQITQL